MRCKMAEKEARCYRPAGGSATGRGGRTGRTTFEGTGNQYCVGRNEHRELRRMMSAPLPRHQSTILVGSSPTPWIQPPLGTPGKTGIRPIHNCLDVAMLDRVVVQIVHVAPVILFVADGMFPETPLPDATFAPHCPDTGPPLDLRELSREPRLDQAPAIGETGIAGRQGPDAMQVSGITTRPSITNGQR